MSSQSLAHVDEHNICKNVRNEGLYKKLGVFYLDFHNPHVTPAGQDTRHAIRLHDRLQEPLIYRVNSDLVFP